MWWRIGHVFRFFFFPSLGGAVGCINVIIVGYRGWLLQDLIWSVTDEWVDGRMSE